MQDSLGKLNVQYQSSGDDFDVYTADIEDDDKTYRIAYCPATIALQLNADDLGGINWDNEAYYISQE